MYNINAKIKAELSVMQSFNVISRNIEKNCNFDKAIYVFELVYQILIELYIFTFIIFYLYILFHICKNTKLL